MNGQTNHRNITLDAWRFIASDGPSEKDPEPWTFVAVSGNDPSDKDPEPWTFFTGTSDEPSEKDPEPW
jgi:hypothetical protein